MSHKFPYKWNMGDGYPSKNIEYHGKTVFGTFVCGGGSTMGYKLAGFNHLGGVEIDNKITDVYRENHKPLHLFNMDIRNFNKSNIPQELYGVDLLDGSPPCSAFSMSGSRESAWGKEKQFREGQSRQTLDDLFFEFIKTAEILQPKTIVAENVKGMLIGNAKAYVSLIQKRLIEIGYNVQIFCLNAASMGVPQKRERVFFICHKKEYSLPKLVLNFDEKPIFYGEFRDIEKIYTGAHGKYYKLWENRKNGDSCMADIADRLEGRRSGFNTKLVNMNNVCDTIVSGSEYHDFENFAYLSKSDYLNIGTFPQDYDFGGQNVKYLIGMSVPPVMTAQIAHQIYLQWLSKI